VPTGSDVEKRTVGELDIRSRTGAVVVAVIHGRAVDPRPGPDSAIHGGDRIALIGSADERQAGRALIESAFSPASG